MSKPQNFARPSPTCARPIVGQTFYVVAVDRGPWWTPETAHELPPATRYGLRAEIARQAAVFNITRGRECDACAFVVFGQREGKSAVGWLPMEIAGPPPADGVPRVCIVARGLDRNEAECLRTRMNNAALSGARKGWHVVAAGLDSADLIAAHDWLAACAPNASLYEARK